MLVSSITRLDVKVEQTLSLLSVTRLDTIGRSVGRAIDSVGGSAIGRSIDSTVGSAMSRAVGSAMGRAIGRAMCSSAPFVRIGDISVTKQDTIDKLTVLFTSVTRLDAIGKSVFSSALFVKIGVFCFCFVKKTI